MDQQQENEKEEEALEDLKSEQRSLLIILSSLVGISLVVILGVFIFFPFNSSNEPSIVVEKKTNNKINPSPALEENSYITNLNQTNPSGNLTSSQEEFFLEISPEGISKPIASLPQGAEAPSLPKNESQNEPKVNSSIPAKVSKPEEPIKTAPEASPSKKEVPITVEKPKSNEPAKNIENPAPVKTIFWIQIGSYSDEKLANNTLERLKVEGFEAQKFKFNSGEKVLNRVRMGPYETKAEANKFLKWIQEGNDFQESYIVESKA